MNSQLIIGEKKFDSRLFLGTGKFGSYSDMQKAIIASGSQLVTVALKRVKTSEKEDELMTHLKLDGLNILPNTSGARNAKEAIFAAQLCREAFETNFLKLEIHPDPRYLMPDPIETLEATEQLVKLGFVVMPYCSADPVLCKRLEEAGSAVVMPLGSAIGSNMGLQTKAMLEIIIEQSNIPVVIDAGIGTPSQAAEAMEMGADAVLVNTAIAVAGDSSAMANAFRLAVIAGRIARESRMGQSQKHAKASSPFTSFLMD